VLCIYYFLTDFQVLA